MEFIYSILPLVALLLVIIGLVKLFTKNQSKVSQFSFYNYKILIAAIVIGLISGIGSLQAGLVAAFVSFMISFILWYFIITSCIWIAYKVKRK